MHQNSRHGSHRRGEVSSPNGLGNPTPTGLTVRYGITCRSSGALRCLVYAACYKHIAPLGLNAAMHRNSRHCIYRRGEVSLPSGLGNPTPTGLTVRYAITCRPSGALRCLVYAACYKHVAPLGLNAPMHRNSRHCIYRRGEVSSSSGLGTQPLRIQLAFPASLRSCVKFSSRTRYHLSPLWGFGIFGVSRVL